MTHNIEITRGEIIEQLIKSDIDDFEMNPEKIEDLLTIGFIGYANLNDNNLMLLYRQYISEDPEYDLTITLLPENFEE